MRANNNRPPPWRLALILAAGGVALLALQVSGSYVDGINDHVAGPVPLSWSFKATARQVTGFFSAEAGMNSNASGHAAAVPEIDRVAHGPTRTALFALG